MFSSAVSSEVHCSFDAASVGALAFSESFVDVKAASDEAASSPMFREDL
jgi:hypothetical protein